MMCKAFPPPTGGVEMCSDQVARAYLRAALEVVVITQTERRAGWRTLRFPEGQLRLFNAGVGGQFVTAVRMCLSVARVIRNNSFAFYHTTAWRPAMPLIAAQSRMPVAITMHWREILSVRHFLRPFMRGTLRRAALVVAVSSASRERGRICRNIKDGRSRWIIASTSNGLPLVSSGATSVRARQRIGGPVQFLTLARLVERKNVQGCISALRESGDDDFGYRIASTGPLAVAL